MTALADAQSPEEFGCTGSALDWSIDTLAELKPVIFSPLPQQKFGASTLGTPHGTIGFFEDEKQYEVLRTPLQPTPTPFVRSPRSTTPKQSSKLRLSFGLSPITFLSPQAEEKIEEEKSSEDKPSNGNTLFLDSLFANESEKEISEQQAKMEDGGQQDECTSSSHGNSTSARMRFSLMEPVRSSMPRRRRQQAFMEAMEAEARSSETCGKVSPMR
ncbi:hypothetical protein PInf_004733 [Phytophthora infestans]|nr:hypothetical protein PInf_004733 [Phytophthora infestans]